MQDPDPEAEDQIVSQLKQQNPYDPTQSGKLPVYAPVAVEPIKDGQMYLKVNQKAFCPLTNQILS